VVVASGDPDQASKVIIGVHREKRIEGYARTQVEGDPSPRKGCPVIPDGDSDCLAAGNLISPGSPLA
jgi:hypothetical protein